MDPWRELLALGQRRTVRMGLPLVDATIEAVDKLSRLNAECVADSEQSSYRDRPARFYLLPMAG